MIFFNKQPCKKYVYKFDFVCIYKKYLYQNNTICCIYKNISTFHKSLLEVLILYKNIIIITFFILKPECYFHFRLLLYENFLSKLLYTIIYLCCICFLKTLKVQKENLSLSCLTLYKSQDFY